MINRISIENTNIFSNIIKEIQDDMAYAPLPVSPMNGGNGGMTIRRYTHGTSIRLKKQAITATTVAEASTGNVPRWL